MACYCCVSGCKSNNHKASDLHFFRFPKNDVKRQKLWRKFSRQKKINKTAVICEKHFEQRYLLKKDKKVKLANNAVPTIFLKRTREGVEEVLIEFDGDNYVGAEAEIFNHSEETPYQETVAFETAFINEQEKLDDIKNRCRFCAEVREELIEMSSFVTYNIDISNILSFLNLNVIVSDFFPNNVCEECFNQVLQMETFIVKCKGADQWLWEEIGKLKTVSVTERLQEPVEEIEVVEEDVGIEKVEVDDQANDNYSEFIEECHSETEDGSTIPPISEDTEQTSNSEQFSSLPVMDPSCNKFAMKSYSCEVCLVVFAGLKTYRSHVCDVPEIRCPECHDIFKTVFDLKKHRKHLHKECLEKNYCPICRQVITGKPMVFKKHKAKCNREMNRNIECNICHKIFPSLYTFTVHQMFHESKKNLEKDVLETPKPVKKKPEVICEQCGKIYTTIGDCRRHMRLKHMEIKEVFKCDICNKNYPSKSVLKDHFRNTHVVNEVPCTFCGKIFRNKTHLKKHMVYHDESKKIHKCLICPDQPGFINKVSLQRHQTRHANFEEKVSYNCEYCVNFNFHTSFQLKSHLKHVHGIDQ